eukprot:CAMPEP_0177177376 /NCGR_PEP_ID=MMETSP0367-20130122/13765_1 /TAXON_ID=447022 ORGANISM="Scrippsiella hangoei-like, Strain SHHI-4" /NCGR_SAMPLE_ID=MMETSP0367 /ASSEMBLY_ACC=CAM_ASM_000362 /LENGTH=118 /DNA_ID=CAMNT_0018623969 /DNA_START=98 /DNA_END=454 /DNA_ORIENTATION=-
MHARAEQKLHEALTGSAHGTHFPDPWGRAATALVSASRQAAQRQPLHRAVREDNEHRIEGPPLDAAADATRKLDVVAGLRAGSVGRGIHLLAVVHSPATAQVGEVETHLAAVSLSRPS